jgi:hypothetical protein
MLTLRQPTQYPTKFLQDMADASPLSGMATFGGFSTFVNGTFGLLFGANVIYFAFGKFHPTSLRLRAEKTDRPETAFRARCGARIPAPCPYPQMARGLPGHTYRGRSPPDLKMPRS